MKKVEEETGISQVKVSRWAKRLNDPEKYRAQICGAEGCGRGTLGA
jgi:hypothetical protein